MRKNSPLSGAVESPGLVAEGEIMAIPLGRATLERIAPVTPEQSAPTMAWTPSAVISRSAAAVATPASIQVESARRATTLAPPSNVPLSLISFMASSAPSAIWGVSDSMGPVKPKMMPILTSCACAPPARQAILAVAMTSFLMSVLHSPDGSRCDSDVIALCRAPKCREDCHEAQEKTIHRASYTTKGLPDR